MVIDKAIVSELKERTRAQKLALFGALAFVCIFGRVLCAPFPQVQPLTLGVCIAGAYWGKSYGGALGVAGAFISNVFLGQGVWTIWQACAWGSIGFFAGALLKDKPFWAVGIYAVATSFLFGMALDVCFAVLMGTTTAFALGTAVAAGLVADTLHAAGTAAFAVLVYTVFIAGSKVRRSRGKVHGGKVEGNMDKEHK
ncbi:MAG: hypothetical protein LBM21_00765 [Coriobacteriales bacterium]|jgi:energy-coupling factor transport system substrate-specific component|nr:hypothetical protein [Coriobacteriales bacterium]